MGSEGAKTATTARRTVGCMGCLAQFGMGGVFLGLVGVLAGAAVVAYGYQDMVVDNPGSHLEREHIQTIIAQETPVTYADGVTPVGVFFTQEHRQSVGFDELPQAYVMSLVAAEDGRFWHHPGINPKGIARAMRDNFAAGGVVAGGSTLTQQTAKNIYYRPDRSVKAKLVELLNEYLTAMTDILVARGGTLDKYEGDAIIALVEEIEGEHLRSSKFRLGSSRDQQTGSLDAGANVDCRPEQLARFATLGVAYAQALGVETPRVGLLSNGEEAGKGNTLVKAALHHCLKEKHYNVLANCFVDTRTTPIKALTHMGFRDLNIRFRDELKEASECTVLHLDIKDMLSIFYGQENGLGNYIMMRNAG